MQIENLDIPDVKLITLRAYGDARGALAESFSRRRFEDAGLPGDFPQSNLSYSRDRGTVRGLHYQKPPHAQGKLVQVMAGAILDVAVDLRQDSPTFGKHVAVRLEAGDWRQLYVPAGFAHGFCTLMPETTVHYNLTDYYAPDCEGGVLWHDPSLGIDWPVNAAAATVSEKDSRWLPLAETAADELF
ncbi:dTDP-4-dehydrorhamnose 3,5-epimerase [Ferruginivarius sediminum]|uniref:dTDP-4-dehydrorhamnose 3,5-epimerase n=1 Tax=Ferruginivarius sediminum TaxID=2661937 RepID=A0A369TAC3_9PROT|nr:dTDP-4-dehydrorhamnose 3,5-epimerase [Ferruginivarius sediminum]RDD62263.1 dTDP-4-dehydrorhamnose 3,5-epimerase [Ferruginivarius sediminum]